MNETQHISETASRTPESQPTRLHHHIVTHLTLLNDVVRSHLIHLRLLLKKRRKDKVT